MRSGIDAPAQRNGAERQREERAGRDGRLRLRNDLDTAKFVRGLVVTMFGTAGSWRSKLPELVATSTCRAEYIAAFKEAREVVWLRPLHQKIGFDLKGLCVVFEDNAAAKWTTETIRISDANKHIRVEFHWVWQCIGNDLIQLCTVGSNDNSSEALTKAPTRETLAVLIKGSGMRDLRGIGQLDQGG